LQKAEKVPDTSGFVLLYRYLIVIAVMSLPMALIYFRNERDSDLARLWPTSFSGFLPANGLWSMLF
jgi:hypothetical protein